MRPLLAAWVVLGFSGCGQQVYPAVWEPPADVALAPPTVRDRLEVDTPVFRMLPVASTGHFVSRRVVADERAVVPFAIADGAFEAQAFSAQAAFSEESAHQLGITRFAATLQDVKFSALQLPPTGLTLTNVRFELAEPATLSVRWFGGDNLGWAKGRLTVNIHTSFLLSNGAVSPLQVARLEVPVELTVSQTADGVLGVWMRVARDGALWNWAGLFELSDLTLSLEAFEVLPADQPPVVLN